MMTSLPRSVPELGIVHVYLSTVADRGDDGIRQDALLLSPSERQIAQRFVFDKDRKLYCMAHALLRRVLSNYTQLAPDALHFELGSHGKPALSRVHHPALTQLRFNLSHSQDVAACALTTGIDVGIDVEAPQRGAPLDVADRFFSPSEVRELRSLPTDLQASRFFEYWTLKESYIKARGLGLALPLHAFSFSLPAQQSITISFTHEIVDTPSDWHFWTWLHRRRYQVSVAIQSRELMPNIVLCSE